MLKLSSLNFKEPDPDQIKAKLDEYADNFIIAAYKEYFEKYQDDKEPNP